MNATTGAVSRNPFTGDVSRNTPFASAADVDTALQQTWSAFQGWRVTDISARSALLRNIAGGLRQHARELAEMMTDEMGKPVTQGLAEVEKARVCANGMPSRARNSSSLSRRWLRTIKPLCSICRWARFWP